MKALSIRQPWAWLIVNGHKDIENRTWATSYRGPLLIHASAGMTLHEYNDVCEFLADDGRLRHLEPLLPLPKELERGGIVGVVTLTECGRHHPSPWYMGAVGFTLRDAKPLPFRPLKGALGIFNVPDEFGRTNP